MKRFGKFILIIVVLVIIVTAGAFLFLDQIVQKGVEKIGPAIAKVEVKLKDADLSPLSGSGKLQGLVVGNPPGFKTATAIQVGSVDVKVDPGSIMGEKIVVRHIRMNAPEITLELGPTGNNLSKILENVQGTETKPPASEEEKKATTKKLQVDEFVIAGARVTVAATALGGKGAGATLPEIRLANLGQGPEGITPAELTKRVLSALLDGTMKSIGGSLGEMGKDLTESAKSLGTGAVNQATEKFKKGVEGIFKKKE